MRNIEADDLEKILARHLDWLKGDAGGERANLSGVNLSRVNLSHTNLRSANLSYTNFRGSDLSGSDLRGVDLCGANLSYTNFRGSDLSGSNLSGSNLRGSDLRGVDLCDANFIGAKELDSVIMPGGFTFAVYKAEVVPALLAAGGRDPKEVAAKSWACHAWTNCPMAEAFGVHDLFHIPPLYREQARLFIQFFDARLLPNPYETDEF